MREYKNIPYSTVSPKYNYLNLLLPDCDCKAIFVYIHGGGLTVREPGEHIGPFMENLCKRGIGVATIEYRGFPEHRYPDFIDDSACAVAWIKNHIHEYVDCKKIYVGGSSAGGYLSMMLCFDKKYLGIHDISPMDIAGFIHDAGQPTAHFNVLKSRGIDPRRLIVDESSPMYHVGVDSEYPPMIFIVSDNDMENRYEQTLLMKSTLKHFGHEDNVYLKVMNGTHCHYVDAEDGVFAGIIADFIEKTL
ncbi:MAG: alpha/beta hydrolase [Clostridia bacterium]|nr:alpha/beta hydrolase [Clostridia bacterium]